MRRSSIHRWRVLPLNPGIVASGPWRGRSWPCSLAAIGPTARFRSPDRRASCGAWLKLRNKSARVQTSSPPAVAVHREHFDEGQGTA